MKKIKGLTLIELMIASFIAGLVVIGATSLYLQHVRYFQSQSEFVQQLDSIRYAFMDIRNSIHSAGYRGCGSLNPNSIFSTHDPSLDNAIIGYKIHSPSHPQELPDFIASNSFAKASDVLVLRYMSNDAVPLRKTMSTPRSVVVVDEKSSLEAEDQAIIADCEGADIFSVTKRQSSAEIPNAVVLSHAEPHNVTSNLRHRYLEGALVGHYEEIAYYLAPSTIKDKTAKTKIALYKKMSPRKNKASALIADLEKFELQYGVISTSGSIDFLAADAIKDWSKVISVTINIDTKPLGSSGDVMRWTTSVSLRNR